MPQAARYDLRPAELATALVRPERNQVPELCRPRRGPFAVVQKPKRAIAVEGHGVRKTQRAGHDLDLDPPRRAYALELGIDLALVEHLDPLGRRRLGKSQVIERNHSDEAGQQAADGGSHGRLLERPRMNADDADRSLPVSSIRAGREIRGHFSYNVAMAAAL